LLVLSLAPTAHATEVVPHDSSKPCHASDGSTLVTSASVAWTDATDGSSLKYLTGITVNNGCNRLYTSFWLVQRIHDGTPGHPSNHAIRTLISVAPGASRTLNKQALVHLGLWQLPFNTRYIHVMQHSDACGTGFLIVRADGYVPVTTHIFDAASTYLESDAVFAVKPSLARDFVLRSADELAVHRDREASVIVLEYAVHGQAVQTGRTYDNRFVSVITIKERKVTHWRDYLDPVAVFNALGWPAQ